MKPQNVRARACVCVLNFGTFLFGFLQQTAEIPSAECSCTSVFECENTKEENTSTGNLDLLDHMPDRNLWRG